MIYDILAPLYDAVNAVVPYEKWAEAIVLKSEQIMGKKPKLALDLGCGTGAMTYALATHGLDMIGVDASLEMLNAARAKAENMKTDFPILWLGQDMTDFELYGTVEIAVSTLDCLNHLSPDELKKVLALLHNYIEPDGLFFFDLNTLWKFENLYGNEAYTFENSNSFAVWENEYRPKTKTCDFYITVFQKQKNGTYVRFDDCQREKYYSVATVNKYLTEAGFEPLGAFADYDGSPLLEDGERMFFIARCRKDDK